MAKEKKLSTTVVRVKHTTLAKIEKMKKNKEKSADYLERIVDLFEKMVDSPNLYITEGDQMQVFTDIADARGAAIIQAVRSKTTPKMPKVAVIVGSDTGE